MFTVLSVVKSLNTNQYEKRFNLPGVDKMLVDVHMQSTEHQERKGEYVLFFKQELSSDSTARRERCLFKNLNKNSPECYVAPALHLYIQNGVKASV